MQKCLWKTDVVSSPFLLLWTSKCIIINWTTFLKELPFALKTFRCILRLSSPLHSLLRPTSDALLLIHTNKLWSTSQMTRDTWLSFNGQRIECHWRLSLNIPMPSSHTLASSVPCRPSKLNGLGKQSEIIFWYVTIFTVLFVNFFLMWTKKYCSKS